MNAREELRREAAQRAVALGEASEAGIPIVEYIGNFVPEEIIHASGAKAWLNCRGGEPEPPDAVLTDMLRFTNPLSRSQVGFYKLGLDPVTPMADLVAVSQYECHQARMAEYMELLGLPVYKIGVPLDWQRDFAQEYYFDGLRQLKGRLEEITGKPITDEALESSLRLYNRLYRLLGEISGLRGTNASPLSGTDFIKLNHDTFMVDPEFAVKKLEEIREELKTAPPAFAEDAPRLLLVGHAVAIGDYIVTSRIEEYGALIAAEWLEEGMHWYQWPAAEGTGDPLGALFRSRYLDKPPINNFEPAWETRIAYVEDLICEKKIDGVLWYQLLYDEIWDLEYTCLAKRLKELDMPVMRIETSYEYTREAMLPLNTRLESFIALLKDRKRRKSNG